MKCYSVLLFGFNKINGMLNVLLEIVKVIGKYNFSGFGVRILKV